MATTYEPIATTTLGSAQADVEFTSISGSYTDLILVFTGTKSTIANAQFRVNGDTGSNYSQTNMWGNGTSAASNRYSNASFIYADLAGDNPGTQQTKILQFNNYSNTTTYKSVLIRDNQSAEQVLTGVGLWRSTAAITSIKLYLSSGNWASGSTFTLYGIKAA